MSTSTDFFRNRLDQMIDLRHPLAVLANRMPWHEIEASLAHRFAHQVRAGKKIEDMDMFGPTQVISGAGVSNAGRPRLPSHKTKDKQPKLYSWHAPEVECISKGKSRHPYEFGVKVGIATKLKGTLIVGTRVFPGNPYNGHTLNEQVEQASILMQATGTKPETACVDLGYRCVDKDNLGIDIKHRGKLKSLTDEEKKFLKRRQAIEPIIGHLKADHRMNRCHLKGSLGDSLHAVLCAAGYNIRWLLRMIAKKGIGLFLRHLQASKFGQLSAQLRSIFFEKSLNTGSMSWAAA